jgi:hypothetical protein
MESTVDKVQGDLSMVAPRMSPNQPIHADASERSAVSRAQMIGARWAAT